MHIEVILNDVGSITTSQKVDVNPGQLKKLAAHAHSLLYTSPRKLRIGFGAGNSLDTERAED